MRLATLCLSRAGAFHDDAAMRSVTSVRAMQRLARSWQRQGVRIGLVPTMGCLHEGHLSLVRRAREAVGPKGRVVVSIFVNPAQFGPGEDLARYPRDLARDRRLCRVAGVDLVFAPSAGSMYLTDRSDQRDAFSTWVVEETLSRGMEGESRPTHFRGVTTVVAMLFNLILPDVAVFGAKDYQQASVVRRMVRDLHFAVRILVAPTCREGDGLAMSSRNQYLTGARRRQARVLRQALLEARAMVRRSRRALPASVLRRRLQERIEREPEARVDYIQFFKPATLAPVTRVGRRDHLALAVFVGKTRLIDNGRL